MLCQLFKVRNQTNPTFFQKEQKLGKFQEYLSTPQILGAYAVYLTAEILCSFDHKFLIFERLVDICNQLIYLRVRYGSPSDAVH